MLKFHAKWLAAGAIALAGFLASPAQAGTIVVPNAVTNTEGNSNNQALNVIRPPLPVSSTDSRIQQIYNASQFGGTTQTITGIRFRPDGVLGSVMASQTYQFQIVVGTTTSMDFGAAGFNNNLNLQVDNEQNVVGSRNLGGNNLLATTEARTVSSSNTGLPGGPKAFDIFIPFTANFVYNPALGNLFLDITTLAELVTAPTVLDAHNDGGTTVRSLSSSDIEGAGAASNIGLVTQFQTLDAPPTPIPEPGTITLFGLGVAGLIGAARRRARSGSEAPEETPAD